MNNAQQTGFYSNPPPSLSQIEGGFVLLFELADFCGFLLTEDAFSDNLIMGEQTYEVIA